MAIVEYGTGNDEELQFLICNHKTPRLASSNIYYLYTSLNPCARADRSPGWPVRRSISTSSAERGQTERRRPNTTNPRPTSRPDGPNVGQGILVCPAKVSVIVVSISFSISSSLLLSELPLHHKLSRPITIAFYLLHPSLRTAARSCCCLHVDGPDSSVTASTYARMSTAGLEARPLNIALRERSS